MSAAEIAAVTNGKGITFDEWLAIATTTRRGRNFNTRVNSPFYMAWQAGEDPLIWAETISGPGILLGEQVRFIEGEVAFVCEIRDDGLYLCRSIFDSEVVTVGSVKRAAFYGVSMATYTYDGVSEDGARIPRVTPLNKAFAVAREIRQLVGNDNGDSE